MQRVLNPEGVRGKPGCKDEAGSMTESSEKESHKETLSPIKRANNLPSQSYSNHMNAIVNPKYSLDHSGSTFSLLKCSAGKGMLKLLNA